MALASALEVISLVELSVKYGEIIKTFIHDVRYSGEEQDEMLVDVSYRLKVIDLHEGMLQKLPKSDVEALQDRMKRMKKSAEELVGFAQKLRTSPYGALKWATGKKRKLQKIVDTILGDQANLALELIVHGVSSILPIVDGETRKIVDFIDKSLARRQDTSLEVELELPPVLLHVLDGRELEDDNFETGRSQNGNHSIVETHSWESPRDKENTLRRIREVATTFHAATLDDRNFQSRKANIAQCLGYIPLSKCAKMIFELPSGIVGIQSLRQLLATENTYSLNARLGLARSLSTAVFFTHAYHHTGRFWRFQSSIRDLEGD
ncbi:hypothetical protein M409DRAFT_26592 [Zasmidium cellare ATCC 36951]|uniref:Uncharacterized protein n=1 Tax=Zasmidium cellare ATCC 36951 TaxID=1080233 RepID=A0A6A6C7I2_ZASCE|nr:uncharacterized protein M409DRAFT_26592 [Zasmidium cellare ATCC 36951]KAF2163147.1 hypothetical protein M409DRAFT_26592 [Zasmidium cellare ATCC 36951]